MGLDMYLKARGKAFSGADNSFTGACGGLFPITIYHEDNEAEIGYWRKDYDLAEEILSVSDFDGYDDNCVDIYMSPDACREMLDISKSNGWVYSADVFKKAIELYDTYGEDIEIYYYQWY